MRPLKGNHMEFIEELKWRGLVKDVTDLDGLVETLKTPTTVYCGFDPTADSECRSYTDCIMRWFYRYDR